MLSTYYVEVHTGTDYGADEYDAAAGRLAAVVVSVLSDTKLVNALTHEAPRQSCTSSVEICMEGEERELVAKAVVDVTAEQAVKFDKALLSRLLKERTDEWKLKVTKKAVL